MIISSDVFVSKVTSLQVKTTGSVSASLLVGVTAVAVSKAVSRG